MQRQIDWPDRIISVIDQGLRTLAAAPAAVRPSPGTDFAEPHLTLAERRRSASLMRVNHAGEIAAQALYTGQAAVTRSTALRKHLLNAAQEERDHLGWCAERLGELDGRTSLLGPFWYAGSFCIGLAAGSLGDPISLGFVSETERQVEVHIADHMQRLPAADSKSRSILRQMAEDEARHGTAAQLAGGASLPGPIRKTMALGGEFLRRTAYFL